MSSSLLSNNNNNHNDEDEEERENGVNNNKKNGYYDNNKKNNDEGSSMRENVQQQQRRQLLVQQDDANDNNENDEVSIVRCGTTAGGSFTMEFHRRWSPRGYKRVVELFERGFYDSSHFFRVIPNFLVQFGITYSTSRELKDLGRDTILDDAQLNPPIEFTPGTISFAGSGPNSRTSQLFIAYQHSDSFGKEVWETPVGRVVSGMDDVVRNFYSGYGDMPPWGNGPEQSQIHAGGRKYMEENFPLADRFLKCKVINKTTTTTAAAAAAAAAADKYNAAAKINSNNEHEKLLQQQHPNTMKKKNKTRNIRAAAGGGISEKTLLSFGKSTSNNNMNAPALLGTPVPREIMLGAIVVVIVGIILMVLLGHHQSRQKSSKKQ